MTRGWIGRDNDNSNTLSVEQWTPMVVIYFVDDRVSWALSLWDQLHYPQRVFRWVGNVVEEALSGVVVVNVYRYASFVDGGLDSGNTNSGPAVTECIVVCRLINRVVRTRTCADTRVPYKRRARDTNRGCPDNPWKLYPNNHVK